MDPGFDFSFLDLLRPSHEEVVLARYQHPNETYVKVAAARVKCS
jgi:hypothetical protein